MDYPWPIFFKTSDNSLPDAKFLHFKDVLPILSRRRGKIEIVIKLACPRLFI